MVNIKEKILNTNEISEWEFNCINFIRSNEYLSSKIEELELTNEEIIKNALMLLKLKEINETPDKHITNYEIRRDENNKLIFEPFTMKNDSYFRLTWFKNMEGLEISQINSNLLLSNLEMNKEYKKIIFNYLKTNSTNNLYIKTKILLSPLGQMLANYFAYQGTQTIYVDIAELHNHLIKKLNDKGEAFQYVLDKLTYIPVLVIDQLGIEPQNNFIHFNVLMNILKVRQRKKLPTIIISNFTMENLGRSYLYSHKKEEAAKVQLLIDLIKNNSIVIHEEV